MTHFRCLARAVAFVVALSAATSALAEEKLWSVSKSSGEVWVTTPGAQQASLTQDAGLKPGDAIRTGRNGRVLLVRGEESILISPNSAIGIPAASKDGLATTIVQQAGSILLEVEKRNVKHFEVETPYLAAVVKGTQFRVSVSATGTSVNVMRGQVEVADFKSGQIAQIMPGQFATAFAGGKSGLSLGGAGTFAPIEQGRPRAPSIERLMVPRNGLSAPRHAANQQVQPLAQVRTAAGTVAKPGVAAPQPGKTVADTRAAPRGLRIASPIGDVRLNFQKVTNGVARGVSGTSPSRRAEASRDTIWSGRDGKTSTTGTSVASSSDTGNAAVSVTAAAAGSIAAPTAAATTGTTTTTTTITNPTTTNPTTTTPTTTTTTAAVTTTSGNSGGGSTSTGNGRGRTGSESEYVNNRGGNGHGNGGNGNGNGGVGNGNGNGNSKH
jgi:hypothetical protein